MKTQALERLFTVGRCVSPIYACLMRQREFLYRQGIFTRHHAGVPVVSIGNLTMGGTGKTPMVVHLARLLAGKAKPAVISRGYGGQARAAVNIVSDGKTLLLPVDLAGDEPFMIAEKLPNIPVLTGKKRIFPARHAVDNLQANVLLLDDGFQHMALHRDVNLVLFSGQQLLGNGRIFPGGPLREPLAALERADAFVVTGVDQNNAESVEDFRHFLVNHFEGKPFFTAGYQVAGFRKCHAVESLRLEDARSQKWLAFCGIASPQSFLATLNQSGIRPVHFVGYGDHHRFTEADMANLERQGSKLGIDGFLVTEKDAVKLNAFSTQWPIYACQVEFALSTDFDRFIMERLVESGLSLL